MPHKQLTIDPEFRELCRALTPEERSLLEASIEADGCRDDIVTWANHDDTILDGHSRYEICTQLDIKFKTTAINLSDRHACIEWIIANQLGKRNLTDEEKSFLRGKRYRAEKRDVGHPKPETASGLDTAKRLAQEYGVSERTVYVDANFADAVDKIAENVGPDAKQEILSGKSGLSKKQIQNVGTAPPEEQKKAYEEAKETPRARPVKKQDEAEEVAPAAKPKRLTKKRLQAIIAIVLEMKQNADKPALQVSIIDIRSGLNELLTELESITPDY